MFYKLIFVFEIPVRQCKGEKKHNIFFWNVDYQKQNVAEGGSSLLI